jgi:PAS domain S-box-containing protein
MTPILRVLIVEDNRNEVLLLLNELAQGGFKSVYEVVDNPERMRIALEEKEWDIVIADYSLPHFSALAALELSKEINARLPFIMISERLGEEVAVAAMKAGVDDYILKDNLSRLVPAIQDELKLAQGRRHFDTKVWDSETRYRSVISAMAEGIVLQDAAGVILACNSNAERILGLTADQMMGRTSVDPRWQAIHEDDSPFPGETHPAMVTLRTGKPCSKVIMGVHKPDERLTWLSINSEPLFRANEPMPYAVVASFSDITEQKDYENLLRRQNKQLAALQETTLALIKQLELDELLTEIIRKAAALVNTEHGYLFVLEPEIERLIMRVGIGVFESNVGHQQLLGEGLSGEAWRLRGSVTVRNYQQWSGRLDGLDPLCAVVATPLHVGDKILGFLGLAYLEEGPMFDAEKLNLLEQFAALASVALENAHLYNAAREELAERQRAEETLRQSEARLQHLYSELQAVSKAETNEHARRLALLDEMSREMNSALNEREIFKIATGYISQLIQTERTAITLLTETKDSVQIVAFEGTPPKKDGQAIAINQRLPLAKKLLQKAIEEKRLVIVSDANQSELEHSDTSSMMIAPLIMGEEVIGTVNVVRQKNFTKRDKDLLLHLASFLGITIESSRRKKELEKAREEAEKARLAAESANRAKSTFLANMSHELRTPLNGILGYAQLLSRGNDLTAMQKKGLNIIQNSGEHLLTLLNDILDLSKIEVDQMELHPATFHLQNMLKGLVGTFQIRAEEKGINFDYECFANLPLGVHGDEKRLRQVLLNLLSNAIKFTSAGEVSLKAGMYRGKIRLQVEDTGIGIAPDALEHIFDPFYQAAQAVHHTGTGLGLAISSKLVEMMGGELYVKSELGKGSVFWVDLDLPQKLGFTTRGEEPQEKIIGFKGKVRKVLVVDDNSQNRLLLNHMLAPLGFEVLEAVNGEDGLHKTIEFEPEVILVDLRMPVMDGFEMMRRIRDLPTGKDKVMITISARVFEDSRKRSLEAGSNEFLTKPFELSQLLALLQTHLEIEWLIESDAPPPAIEKDNSVGRLIPPPRENMMILLDLVKKGNIRRLMAQADKLKELDQQYHPFASKLRLLAEDIKLKELRQLLEEYMKYQTEKTFGYSIIYGKLSDESPKSSRYDFTC